MYYSPGPWASRQTVTRALAKGREVCHTISMNKANEMQVYMVIAGYAHEGNYDGDSIALFDSKKQAEEYELHIVKEWGYDYSEVRVMDVIDQSQSLPN